MTTYATISDFVIRSHILVLSDQQWFFSTYYQKNIP